MKFLVVHGLGKSGKACCAFCKERNIPYLVTDDSPSEGVLTSEKCLEQLEALPKESLVVTSPGIPLNHPVLKKARELSFPVISEVELAFRYVKESPPKMVGITGTNGKTTVVELLQHVLSFAGKNVEAIGNIGTPVIEAFSKSLREWYVVELSSFQLENTYTPLLEHGAILNITPNHLDWHSSMEEYKRAKEKLFHLVKPEGSFFIHESIPFQEKAFRYGFSKKADLFVHEDEIYFLHEKVGRLPLPLQGMKNHDVLNFLAVFGLSLCMGISSEVISRSFLSFKKSPHRIQFVRAVQGKSFYDDSKGTNIAATEAAVASIPGPVVLIAGGVHKGSSYKPWQESLKEKVVCVVAIGQAKELIFQDLHGRIPVKLASSLQEAFEIACSIQEAKSVLLSPGCSSYDMFKDYKERGKKFQELVQAL